MQTNSVAGTGGQAPSPRPLSVSAEWPLRCGVLPTLADRFTPRPETAPDLSRALERGAAVALVPQPVRSSGPAQQWLRTCGKTQLATAFAESEWQAHAIDLLMWVDASSQESLLLGYVDVARSLTGTPMAGAAAPVAASLLAWLGQTEARWLLVLDDVRHGSVLTGLVPAGPAGHVLITGAAAQAVVGMPDVVVAEIGPFSPREAMTYLVSRLSKDPDQRRGAMDLIRELGYQPAALAHSTATIASSWITCADYCERLYRRRAVLGGDQPTAAVTWTLSLDQADQLVPGGPAHYCLAFAAMLDGHGIPAGLFATSAARQFIASERGDQGQSGQPGPPSGRTQLALTSLQQVGLVSMDTAADVALVRLNPALQASARAAMPPDLLAESAAAAAAALLEFWPDGDQRTPVAHHLRASATALLRAGGDAIWARGCPGALVRAGQSADSAGMPAAAVDYWQELSSASDRILGPGHPDSLRLADQLAAACSAAGLLAEAIAARQRLVDERARTLGPQHSLTLAAQVSLGHSLIEAGEISTGIAVLAAAVAESEPRRGPSDPEVLGIRDELARAYIAAGRTADAIAMLKTTLAQRERSRGPAHRDTIETRQRLAEACLAAGQLKDAVSQYRRAVADSEKVNGSSHRATLRARGALAAAYQRTGKIGNAVAMYELTRDGCVRALGPDDPETLASCVSLGQMYYALGHLANATTLLRDTLERCELVLPPGHPVSQSAAESLAAIVGRSG